MKKALLLVVSFIFLTIGIATADVHNLTSVKDDADSVIITITNVRMTPIGKNTEGKNLFMPDTVDIFSGVQDADGIKTPIASVKIIDGQGSFKIPNWAKEKKVSYVEHLSGLSPDKKFALVIDPADPWASYKVKDGGVPDLNTLAIGIIMYPDRSTAPLKPYGKLPQGEHPELAGN